MQPHLVQFTLSTPIICQNTILNRLLPFTPKLGDLEITAENKNRIKTPAPNCSIGVSSPERLFSTEFRNEREKQILTSISRMHIWTSFDTPRLLFDLPCTLMHRPNTDVFTVRWSPSALRFLAIISTVDTSSLVFSECFRLVLLFLPFPRNVTIRTTF